MAKAHLRLSLVALALIVVVGPLVLSVLFRPAPAQAEVAIVPSFVGDGGSPAIGACTHTITNSDIPYTATASGVFCLASDVGVPANAFGITLAGMSGVLDLGGYTIDCGLHTQANGIRVMGSAVNIVIRNGTVQSCVDGIKIGDNGAGYDVIIDRMIVHNVTIGVHYYTGGPLVIRDSLLHDMDTGVFADSPAGSLALKDNVFENQRSTGSATMAMVSLSAYTGRAIIEHNQFIYCANHSIDGPNNANSKAIIRDNSFIDCMGGAANFISNPGANWDSATGNVSN